ncbi:MAG: hypothetical protein RMM58_10885 [Chloroflexota bacterium]|nr:hypothetical protein [Dehalococcoidia bacterium]MDW8254371.1 hypothetical protein [Chloroflexota bacterium]
MDGVLDNALPLPSCLRPASPRDAEHRRAAKEAARRAQRKRNAIG